MFLVLYLRTCTLPSSCDINSGISGDAKLNKFLELQREFAMFNDKDGAGNTNKEKLIHNKRPPPPGAERVMEEGRG